MATMRRRQIYLDADMDDRLKREATDQGISESELIRRKLSSSPSARLLQRFDPDALKPVFELIAKRKALRHTGKGWKWNREELYEERMSRYGKRVPD